jgi:hypothetical protein
MSHIGTYVCMYICLDVYMNIYICIYTYTYMYIYMYMYTNTYMMFPKGHPIVGDIKYGAPQSFKQRDIALHSYYLSVPHPVTGLQMTFTAAPPSIWEGRFGPEVVKAADKLTKKISQSS